MSIQTQGSLWTFAGSWLGEKVGVTIPGLSGSNESLAEKIATHCKLSCNKITVTEVNHEFAGIRLGAKNITFSIYTKDQVKNVLVAFWRGLKNQQHALYQVRPDEGIVSHYFYNNTTLTEEEVKFAEKEIQQAAVQDRSFSLIVAKTGTAMHLVANSFKKNITKVTFSFKIGNFLPSLVSTKKIDVKKIFEEKQKQWSTLVAQGNVQRANKLMRQLAQVNQAIGAIENDKTEAKNAVLVCRGKGEVYQQGIEDLEKLIQTIKQDIQASQGKIKTFDQQIKQQETALAALKKSIKDLEKTIDATNPHRLTDQAKIGQTQDRIADLKTQKKALTAQIQDLKTDRAMEQGTLQTLQAQLKKEEDNLANYKKTQLANTQKEGVNNGKIADLSKNLKKNRELAGQLAGTVENMSKGGADSSGDDKSHSTRTDN